MKTIKLANTTLILEDEETKILIDALNLLFNKTKEASKLSKELGYTEISKGINDKQNGINNVMAKIQEAISNAQVKNNNERERVKRIENEK